MSSDDKSDGSSEAEHEHGQAEHEYDHENDQAHDRDHDQGQSQGETSNPSYAEQDDDDLVSMEETTIHRDSQTGEVLPRRQYVDELGGDIVAKPLLDDARTRFVTDLEDPDKDKDELSNADLAELFDTHLISPNLSSHELCSGGHVTERFIREGMTHKMQDAYYIGILLASDEYEYVDRMRRVERGNFTDAEVEFAIRQQERGQGDGFQPQGERSRKEMRRDRAESRGGR